MLMMGIERFLMGSQIDSGVLVKFFSMYFMKLTAILSLLLKVSRRPKCLPNCKSSL